MATTRRLTLGALGLALLVAVAFAFVHGWRLYRHFTHPFPPPRQVDVQHIGSWMTVGYIARAYGVPPPEIFRALGLPPERNPRVTLADLAAASGRSPDEVVQVVRARVTAWQAAHPAPRGPGPGGRGPGPGPPGGVRR